ncbi:MAG: protein kinase [Gammaproteobacteria bacterium]
MASSLAQRFIENFHTVKAPKLNELLIPTNDPPIDDAQDNYVSFFEHPKREFRPGKRVAKKIGLPIALSRPKEKISEERKINYIAESHLAKELLLRKEVPVEFNQYSLYYNNEGIKIATRAEAGDLNQFIAANIEKLSEQCVRDIIAQLILAVDDLHQRDVVHRDIRSENFLVFIRDGKYHIKLADHDSAIEVDKKGLPLDRNLLTIRGNEQCRSPELQEITKKSTPEENAERRKRLPNLDIKAIDCYAIGKTLLDVKFLLPVKWRNNAKLDKLINGLIAPEPGARFTTKKVLEQEFFARNKTQRNSYFAGLRARVKNNFELEGEHVVPVEKNNPYYLLDQTIKPLYRAGRQAQQVDEQIEEFNQGINSGFQNSPLSEVIRKYAALKKATVEFSKKAEAAENIEQVDIVDKDLSVNLKTLRVETEKKSAEVCLRFLTEEKSLVVLLTKAVAEAYKDYVTKNKLEDVHGEAISSCFGFFARHGAKGRRQAQELSIKVNQAVAANQAPKDIFLVLSEHIKNGGGNHHQYSFKTILDAKIKKMDGEKDIAAWQKHFDFQNKQVAPVVA